MNLKLINLVDMIAESLYALADEIENNEEKGIDTVGVISLRIADDKLIVECLSLVPLMKSTSHPRSP